MKKYPTDMVRIISFTTALSGTLLLTVACATNPVPMTAQDSDPGVFQNLVHGTLVSKATNLPIAGATVFVPKSTSLKSTSPESPLQDSLEIEKKTMIPELSLNSATEQSMGCKLPSEPYSSFACTDKMGNFTISLLNANMDNFKLKFQYNEGSVQTDLSLNDLDSDIGTILFSEGTSEKQKIAIVLDMQDETPPMSNSFDNMISHTMKVELEEKFSKLYDIDENEYDVEFLPFPSLFEDKDEDQRLDIFNYKMVYLITPGDEDLSDLSRKNKLTLLDYISKGGELFVTTLSVEADDASADEYI